MRKVTLAMSTAIIAIAAGFTAMAGTWKNDANGWWYDEGNGSFPKNTWSWIDGNNDGVSECYYFDGNGYCLINTTTPDGYYVNSDGSWVLNGVVKTQDSDSSTDTKVTKSTDVVTGKITIGESKKKKNKNSSKNKNDDYDYEDYEDDNEDDDEDKSSSNKNYKSNKSSKSSSNKQNMLDLEPESSKQLRKTDSEVTLRGEEWKNGRHFFTSAWFPESYAEYYLGKKYKKLTMKVTPYTKNSNYWEGVKAELTISNADTEEVLFSKEITDSTKLLTVEADVTDVDYIRLDYRMTDADSEVSLGNLLMKDAILSK
ncbi:hypothetical protein [Oribacterium sp. FC2011]|uniref:hypothetical protein n=1 Tax=Oribacterium sp. FC2011 TaxID=1408311 RepID=UPI000678BFEF|nr:hypothetical protein [Oribacterium sp. FC2011]